MRREGTGLATLDDERGEEIPRISIERYLRDSISRLAGFLLARGEHETAVSIDPQTLLSWDYQERMGDAA